MQTVQFEGLDPTGEFVPEIVNKVKEADAKLVAFVKERPVVALVAALAAGYVVGRLVSRYG
jgi:hypothetical protein